MMWGGVVDPSGQFGDLVIMEFLPGHLNLLSLCLRLLTVLRGAVYALTRAGCGLKVPVTPLHTEKCAYLFPQTHIQVMLRLVACARPP